MTPRAADRLLWLRECYEDACIRRPSEFPLAFQNYIVWVNTHRGAWLELEADGLVKLKGCGDEKGDVYAWFVTISDEGERVIDEGIL